MRPNASATDLEVVLVVASEDDGGMAKSVGLLARHLPAHGVRTHVLVHRESPLTASLRDANVSFEVVPELIESGVRGPQPTDRGVRAIVQNCLRAPVAVRKLRSVCAARRAQILYSHGTWSNYLAACAGLHRSAPPVVWHIRNDHSKLATRTVGRWLACATPVRAVIAVSQSAARPYSGLSVPVEVVLNGTDLTDGVDTHSRGNLRSHLGLGGEDVLIGFAGRLASHKGIGVLMNAFHLAAPRLPRAHLAVLGGNARHATCDEVGMLRRQADDWGLSTRIHLLGYAKDPIPFMSAFDLCVVPSICRDACPRAVVEALSLGVPVVGSNIGGIPELVRDGANGVLVPPGAAAALADALVALGTDDERRRAMAQCAAESRARFDARHMASQVADVLFEASNAPKST